MPLKKPSRPSNAPKFEYVTSTVSMFQGDGIVVHVVNDSATGESTRVVIYQNTGAGAVVAVDSGNTVVVPTWQWGLGFTLPSNGEYWARISVSSEFLIPKAFSNGCKAHFGFQLSVIAPEISRSSSCRCESESGNPFESMLVNDFWLLSLLQVNFELVLRRVDPLRPPD